MSPTPGTADLFDPAPARPLPELLVIDAQLPQVPPFVLARLAQEASSTAETVLALLDDQPAGEKRARALLTRLAKTALQAQRCARVLGGDHLPAFEHVGLDMATRGALAAAGAAGEGVIANDLHAVTVWMDPAALELVLELALDWAAGAGTGINLRMAFATESLHPDLVLTIDHLHGDAAALRQSREAALDTVQWQLLRLLAQSQMIDPQRFVGDGGATLVLRFPPSPAKGSASPQPQMKPGAAAGGCHVVVVEADDNLRLLMRQLLHDAGIVVEAFPSPRLAEDMSAHFVADVIVSGYPADHPDSLALLAVLRQKNPAVRVIQLTDDDYLFIGPDGTAEAARLGRASVQQVLVQAVLLSVGVFAQPTLAALRRR